MDQVLAQLDLLRNLLAPSLQERRLPPDEKNRYIALSRAQRGALKMSRLNSLFRPERCLPLAE